VEARPVSDQEDVEQDLAPVVRLHPERDLTDDEALVRRAERPPFCAHRRGFTLHEESHTVTCRECERAIDPFEALLWVSREWERHVTFRKEAERRAREAGNRLKELLRLETNARSRLKRLDPAAAKKAPERPWGEGRVGG
jgi:hypothetical protein